MSSKPATRRTIEESFAAAKSSGRLALMPFLSAGYPDIAMTGRLILELESAGADLIEIGFPFSDPIADGPTIQESYTRALANHLKLEDIFTCVAGLKDTVKIPLVAMVSYSLVFKYGLDQFIEKSKASGLNGILIPDLPPPEAQKICTRIRQSGLDTVLLVAPTTTPERRKMIADLCTGFIYYMSISGITGERDKLPADLASNIAALKSVTSKPVCVGFGISRPEHIKQLSGLADGAIVGSAFVKRITQHLSEGPAAVSRAVGDYCRELRANA